MKKPCLLLLGLFCAPFAQDITVSKDSIQVYNSSFSSFADEVIFTSNTSTPVRLDSAFVLIAEMDTAGFSVILARKLMQVEWKGNYSSTQQYLWGMDSVGPDKYKLTKVEFTPPADTPLAFSGTGTTSRMFFLQIGSCFQCNSLPEYPRYIRGTMSLFFSNGQVVELKLWSQDLRTAVRQKSFPAAQLLTSRRFGVRPLEVPDEGPEGVSTSSRSLSFSYRCLANGRRVVANNQALLRGSRISGTKLYEKE